MLAAMCYVRSKRQQIAGRSANDGDMPACNDRTAFDLWHASLTGAIAAVANPRGNADKAAEGAKAHPAHRYVRFVSSMRLRPGFQARANDTVFVPARIGVDAGRRVVSHAQLHASEAI